MNKLKEIEIENNIFSVSINFSDLTISKSEIAYTLGYTDGMIPPDFDEMLAEVLSGLPTRCEIKAGYRVIPISFIKGDNKKIKSSNLIFETDKIVTSQLKNSENAILFLCSIGDKMENWAKEYIRDGDPTLAFFIDTVASTCVESVVDLLHDHIKEKFKSTGMFVTNRYSPGYCNWHVSEQHKLFSQLPERFCGVTLTDSSLMMPIKSISGIIGVGTEVKYREYLCDTCGVKDCTYRAKRIKRVS
jgi:hypothetical protein